MKTKLIKVDKGYYNLEDEKGNVLGTSYQFNSTIGDVLKYKLSKQNCDEIFGVVDVEKLAEECAETAHTMDELYENGLFYGFISGFNKHAELNKDKVFTLEKFIDLYVEETGYGMDMWSEEENKVMTTIAKIIQSIQKPTEIDVEIEMICPHPEDAYRCGLQYGCGDDGCYHPNKVPYLDSEGCLILKPIV